MALGAILGGIAASPFRAAGGIAKGTAKLGYAGAKGLAMTAMDVSGALPLFAAAAGIKKGITAGYKKGKELLRPWGSEPGAVAEDSALAAIAAAASETAKIQAETDKIEAETDALTGKKKKTEAKTTMGGIDVDILEKIYGETVSIREIIGDADPESEKKELALDEQVRHRNFLKALEALGFRGEKKDKGPSFFGNLLEMFKKLLTGIVAGLGLAALIKFWPQLVSAFKTIVDAIANINEFITDMKNFFSGAWDWLTNTTPSDSQDAGAAAAAARAARVAAMDKATRGRQSHRTFKRGSPERILTKGQNRLIDANEKVKEANRLKKVAAQNKLRLANEARARKLAGMKGPTTGATSSTKALAVYKRSITAGTRGGMMSALEGEIEARRGLRWRQSIGSWMESKMASLGKGLADYNLERAKAGQLANTKKFLEASRNSEMKLRKVVMRAFTGERIMTQAQIEGMTKADLKTGKNVLGGKELGNVKRIYDTGTGRTPLTDAEIRNLRKVGYNVKIKPAVGTDLQKVTVHQTATTVAKNGSGKAGSFVGEGEIRANADSRFRRVHRLATAAVEANTGKKIKSTSSTSQAMVQEAHIASKSGTAGKIQQRLAGREVRWGTRIFGTLAIGYHLAKQMGDYYVDVYLPQLAQAKMQLKTKLGREPLPNELRNDGTVKKARLELQRFFHTIGIMAATGIVVGALMAKVGSIIGAKIGALVGAMGMNPGSAALGAVIGGLVGGVVFAVVGFIAGEHIAGATIAGADKMVGGNFIPAGMDYMPDGVLNIGNWYAGYLIRKEDANMEAMRRKQVAEEKLQKDQDALNEALGMGMGQGLGSIDMKEASHLQRKSKAVGLTQVEQKKLDEYLRKQKQMAANTAAKAKREPYLQNISRTSMMSGVDYSQTTPKPKEKGWFQKAKDTAAGLLGFGGDEEDKTAPQTRRVPGRTSNLQNVIPKPALTDPTGGKAATDPNLQGTTDYSGASLNNNIQTNPETIGADLTALGKNGGQPSADVQITNINNTTNSDQQTVSSTAQTSNVITFDKAPSYSPMRARYAL